MKADMEFAMVFGLVALAASTGNRAGVSSTMPRVLKEAVTMPLHVVGLENSCHIVHVYLDTSKVDTITGKSTSTFATKASFQLDVGCAVPLTSCLTDILRLIQSPFVAWPSCFHAEWSCTLVHRLLAKTSREP